MEFQIAHDSILLMEGALHLEANSEFPLRVWTACRCSPAALVIRASYRAENSPNSWHIVRLDARICCCQPPQQGQQRGGEETGGRSRQGSEHGSGERGGGRI